MRDVKIDTLTKTVRYMGHQISEQLLIIYNDSLNEISLKADNNTLLNALTDNKKVVTKLKRQRNFLGILSGVFGVAGAVFAVLGFK